MDWLRLTSTIIFFSFFCYVNVAAFEFWNATERNVSLPNNFLIDTQQKLLVIGAKNSVCHVSLDLKNLTNIRHLPPGNTSYEECRRDLGSEDDCQNHNHVLTLPSGGTSINTTSGMMAINNTLLTCGSNARMPRCYYLERHTLTEIKQESGANFSPPNQDRRSTALWLSTGSLVSALPTDISSKVSISVSDSPFEGTVRVTTKQNDAEWLYRSHHFVSMHEIGEHVFIFFTEEEYEAAGDSVVYSRVARVCKNDLGTTELTTRSATPLFLTYIKARISCASSTGESTVIAYHYNNIQDTFYLPSSQSDNGAQHLYAVFTSAENGPEGSAVCYFTFNNPANQLDIGNVWRGDYRARLSSGWQNVPNYEDFSCDPESPRSLDAARDYQLMANPVTQANPIPLLSITGYTFHKIVVDQVQDLEGTYRTVLFVAAQKDDELVLIKSSTESQQHISQTIVLGESNADVTQMHMYGTGSSAYIYLGTTNGIYRVSGSNCDYYKDCCSCLAARDPYCAYDTSTHQCTEINDDNRDSPNLIQDFTNGDSTQCLVAMNMSNTETMTEQAPSPTSNTACVSNNIVNEASTTTGTSTTDSDDKPKGSDEGPSGTTTIPIAIGPSAGVEDPNASASKQNDHTWPIVGAVSGFIGGVVIGIIIMAVFYNRSNFIFFRRKRARQYSVADAENEFRKSSKRRKSSGGASNLYSKEEEFKNNSGNFTASGTQPNDYTMVTPVKVNDTHGHMNGHVRKCSSPSPFSPDSKSINKPMPVNVPTPTPPYHTASTSSMYGEHNVKSNIKQVEHITNQQRAVYGRNILARSPSIDAKHSVANGYRANGRTLPYKVSYSHDMETVRIAGVEMSCSQC